MLFLLDVVLLGECWIYSMKSRSNNGYAIMVIEYGGQIKHEGVHRVSAHVFGILDIKDKTQLALHKKNCPRKDCFNPDHLYNGNHYQNLQDAKDLGSRFHTHQIEKNHCPHGHSYTKENTYINNGRRICRTCTREATKIWKQKKNGQI